MNQTNFEELLKKRIDKICSLLQSKGQEYSTEQDKLKNFKQGCLMSGQTPRAYLWSLTVKHLECIKEIALDRLSDEYADEKIGDAINYMILLEALIAESDN